MVGTRPMSRNPSGQSSNMSRQALSSQPSGGAESLRQSVEMDSDSRMTVNQSQSTTQPVGLNRSVSNGNTVSQPNSQSTFVPSADSMTSAPSYAKSSSSKKVKVLVASKSPAKLKAVKLGLEEILTKCRGGVSAPIKIEDVEVCPVDGLSSGVSAQPLSDAETLEGARNRLLQIDETLMASENADFAVAIEGGLEPDPVCDTCLVCFAWVLVKARHDLEIVSKSRTATFMLPTLVANAIVEDEAELGIAQDRYFSQFGRDDLGLGKGEAGTIGPLTFGAVSRAQYYASAVTFAFIPFINQKRKFDENVPQNPLAFSCGKRVTRDMSAPPGTMIKRQRSVASVASAK